MNKKEFFIFESRRFVDSNGLRHVAVHAHMFGVFSNVGSVNCPNMVAFGVNFHFHLFDFFLNIGNLLFQR